MTDEERHVLAEELKKNVNHRCQAVPFNTVEWVDGYIAGVIEEKRSNKVLYAIKTLLCFDYWRTSMAWSASSA